MKLRVVIVCVIIAFFVLVLTIIRNPGEFQMTDTALGTTVTIRARGWGARGKVEGAINRIHEVEARMSNHVANSDVSRINRGEAYWGNDETMRVVNRGIFFGDFSNGVFDISINPLVTLYERRPNPTAAEISAARALVDFRRLQVLAPIPTGMSITLDGLLNGYAADEAALFLRRNGIQDLQIEIGGDVVAFGSKRWPVRLLDPFQVLEVPIGTLNIGNTGVATSSIRNDGIHRFNPQTGVAVNNNVASATVIASSGMDADALAAYLFIAGVDGLATIEQLQAKGIVITKNYEVYASPDTPLVITNDSFTRR